jgi:AmmeMemoRadiSam system protein B
MLENKKKIRLSAVAGQFYPVNKKELEKIVDGFLACAESSRIKGEIFGLLLPHAGYVFSGRVVAAGVKPILGEDFETCILLGDSHYERFEGVAVWANGFWETPLGRVEVDSKLARAVLDSSGRFFERDSAHLFEHSIEVQLPFLQKTLRKFKILPLIFGSEDKDWQKLAQVILRKIKGRKVLIVASSDLSHYPSYEEARKVDRETLGAVLTLDPLEFKKRVIELAKRAIPNVQTLMCAQDSVKTLLEVAKNLKAEAKLLEYANSGDALMGDKSRVVGYGAVAFYHKL